MNKKRLITSALPYVNNIPHLGNLIQVLSADVFARFCRSRGYETLYICGTDEYGTATETKALQDNMSPQELCNRYYNIHSDIYQWFNISFDHFGRTSTPQQTQIVQDIFQKIVENDYILEKEIQQLYSEESDMFLPDRYVRGTCPKCEYTSARGDQCESCGSLLDPLELIDPVSAVDNTKPVVRATKHLYINLPKLLPKLDAWVQDSKKKGAWSRNAIKMTEAWIRDGLQERAITRDLKWGIPVPYEGYEDKVFYVWFDAPIGYISITACVIDDWEAWWKNPDNVELFQFIGKDNIPFHTVIFPASLLGTHEQWTMLHRISSSEYLNYEGGMFSKSKGIGVFGNNVQETGVPCDAWRFYMMYNRPESSDYLFTWNDFQDKVNGELINNLSNLYTRSFAFITKNYDKKVLALDLSDAETKALWDKVIELEEEITRLLENMELRQAYLKIFVLANYVNKIMQDFEPWKLHKEDPDKSHWVLSNIVYMIKEIVVLIEPYTPHMAETIASMMNIPIPQWKDLLFENKQCQVLNSVHEILQPVHLFKRLEDKQIEIFKEKFSGSQDDRHKKEEEDAVSKFSETISLKVALIKKVELHPDADKLYILHLDDGSTEGRTIVSSIRDHYSVDELEGKKLIVVANLKPAKFRGTRSEGMLLAASQKISGSTEGELNEIVDVIFVDDAAPGDNVLPQGKKSTQEYARLKIDKFFEFSLHAGDDFVVSLEGVPLMVEGKDIVIKSHKVKNVPVG